MIKEFNNPAHRKSGDQGTFPHTDDVLEENQRYGNRETDENNIEGDFDLGEVPVLHFGDDSSKRISGHHHKACFHQKRDAEPEDNASGKHQQKLLPVGAGDDKRDDGEIEVDEEAENQQSRKLEELPGFELFFQDGYLNQNKHAVHDEGDHADT